MHHVHACHFLLHPPPPSSWSMLMLMFVFRRARGARCRGQSRAATGRRASTSAAPGGSTASPTSTEAARGNKQTAGRQWRTLFSKYSGGCCLLLMSSVQFLAPFGPLTLDTFSKNNTPLVRLFVNDHLFLHHLKLYLKSPSGNLLQPPLRRGLLWILTAPPQGGTCTSWRTGPAPCAAAGLTRSPQDSSSATDLSQRQWPYYPVPRGTVELPRTIHSSN